MTKLQTTVYRAALCLSTVMLLSACTSSQTASVNTDKQSAKLPVESQKTVYSYTNKDRECLKRAMYFESKRSSENGFLAVGSVIMNRLTSGIYPQSICGVVAQKNQFAPGVMTRKMDESTAPSLNVAADAVLKGARHPDVKNAMFFHTEGYTFPYNNMHYVAAAGGNVFYEKRDEDGNLQTVAPKPANSYILAYSSSDPEQNPALSSSIIADATSAATSATEVASASPPPSHQVPSETPAQNVAAGGEVQIASASPNPLLTPIITEAIVRSGMDDSFATDHAVPQNSSYNSNGLRQVSLQSGARIPLPAARPDEQNQPVATGANEPRSLSQANWALRTSSWQ
jgi:spore germination cell wall hydrolase CwlJ-like protein